METPKADGGRGQGQRGTHSFAVNGLGLHPAADLLVAALAASVYDARFPVQSSLSQFSVCQSSSFLLQFKNTDRPSARIWIAQPYRISLEAWLLSHMVQLID